MALPRAATAATGPRDRCHVLPRDRNNNKDRAPIAGRKRIIEKGTTLPRATHATRQQWPIVKLLPSLFAFHGGGCFGLRALAVWGDKSVPCGPRCRTAAARIAHRRRARKSDECE